MKKSKVLTYLIAAVVIVAVLVTAAVTSRNAGASTYPIECSACEGAGCDECGGTGSVTSSSNLFATFWALIPPFIAIGLALVTKEAYSSLFIGILSGAMIYSNFSFAGTVDTLIGDGLIAAVEGNAGIFIFLVELGILVALINKSGAAQAFGRWAQNNIKTKVGALLATFVLGVLIFIDDYFNCLTVGSVMAPVTDAKKISRVKLAYLIDATAAPVCMIAPISSWAAAVSSYVESDQYSGLELFVRAIPFNFYSILTFVFIITLAIMGFDYGKMSGYEIKAQSGDLGVNPGAASAEGGNVRGRVTDMLIPVIILIAVCVVALVYNGGFFDAESEYFRDFIGAFSNTDSTVALPWGGLIALIISIGYYALRRLVSLKDSMDSIPQGFCAMVPAMLILTFATALKNMTVGCLGAKEFVADVMANAASGLTSFLPAVIFLVACVIAFATGTSWGTFGILIPIVTAIFDVSDPLLFVGVSACLAGAVCGDHCSPISDTTIMSSAGAQCNHVAHVSTQLPYAITVAALSFVGFIFAGFVPNVYIVLPVMIVLTVATLFVIKMIVKKKTV